MKTEKMTTRVAVLFLLLLPAALAFTGCAGRYFRKVAVPPAKPFSCELSRWPYREYWMGIVFNGSKIGFSHLSINPARGEPSYYEIRGEAVLRFKFLMFDKEVILKSFDLVLSDLTLSRFHYEYNLDGSKLRLTGHVNANKLEVRITSQGQSKKETIPLEAGIYPTSAIHLYPLLHGLEVGRKYTYLVFDGESQKLSTVVQTVEAFQESELFTGEAFKVKTKLHGQSTDTWIGLDGKPQLEMSMGGVLIAGLETERMAKEYLVQAALNKKDLLLDFSLIESNVPIKGPRSVKQMEIALEGADFRALPPGDEIQKCSEGSDRMICRVDTRTVDAGGRNCEKSQNSLERYLRSSFMVPSENPVIQRAAAKIKGNSQDTLTTIRALVGWIRKNIQRKPVEVFSALDVLWKKEAECQGHAVLYAAFARALNIPTRVVNGVVYSADLQGFLYHTWAESLVDGCWVAVDPTFGEVPADATHIKLVEGEEPGDLMALADFVGKLKIVVLRVDGKAVSKVP